MSVPLIWFKGHIVPSEEALVPVLSPTAQFGLNVFEGIRGYSNKSGQLYLFRLHDHLCRLMQSCRLIGITSPYSVSHIEKAIIATIKSNDIHSDMACRVTLFVEGDGTWSSDRPVDMFVAPILRPRKILINSSGKSACISSWRRIDDNTLPPRAKTGANYISGRYAQLDAFASGVDLPILLNDLGKVSESAGACLMMIREGKLITPTISSSILESITRSTLLAIAVDLGLHVQERSIDRTELYLADEIFLCGSAAELTPITRIDRFSIGDGLPGPLTRKLTDLYYDLVDGTSDSNSSWLTPVW